MNKTSNIDEITREMFCESEDVLGTDYIEVYRAKEYCQKAYEKGLVDAIDEVIKSIDDEYFDGGYGDYHEVAMIVRILKQLKEREEDNTRPFYANEWGQLEEIKT